MTERRTDGGYTPPRIGIDTTPKLPQPPAALVEAAARPIPVILADTPSTLGGQIAIVALALATRIQASGHSVAAAQWAIHHSIQAGRLRAGLVEVGLPSFGTPVWGYDGRLAWSGGGTGTIRLPEGQQAPFDACKVIATPALWEWWRTWTEQQQPDGNDLNWKPINNVQPPLAGAEEVSPGSGEAVNEPVREPAIGFLGGIELANALGVHPTRRAAFSRQLDRHRASLGDDIWHEVSNPRPNSPRYLYRMDSASLRALAASYHEERPA